MVYQWRTPTTLATLGKAKEFLEECLAQNAESIGIETIHFDIHRPLRMLWQLILSTPSECWIHPDITILTSNGHLVVVKEKWHDNEEPRGPTAIARFIDNLMRLHSVSTRNLNNI